VLDFLDCGDFRHVRGIGREHFLQEHSAFSDFGGKADEVFEEASLAWQQVESEHGTSEKRAASRIRYTDVTRR
jgi:hypothetical protein